MTDGSDPRCQSAGSDRLEHRPEGVEPWIKALVEQSPLGISVARDGITLYANQACVRLFGYNSPKDLVGTSQLDRVAPECRAQVAEYIQLRKRGEPAPSAYEIKGLRGDGSTFPLYVEVNRIDWDDGPVSMAYFSDFTARKEMEENLRKAHEELEARVRERTEELASVNEKLLEDIAERLRVEEALRQREQELECRNIKLREMNVTLRTILEQRDQDGRILEQRVSANIHDLVKPLLEKLRKCRTDEQRASCLAIIESNLDEIVSPFTHQLTGNSIRLTPTEIQIANCIRQGMRSKEIASLLRLSKGTIDFHRNNIRRKLDINDRKTSLRSQLLSLTDKV
jgi:PAS domain S-box-containing protein